MYYANCEWYVDMGEHNKPLCERNNLRPAKCSECPVYIKSIEDENAKLREEIEAAKHDLQVFSRCSVRLEAENNKLRELATDACTVLRNHYDKDWFDGTVFAERMRELGIEVSL